MPKEHFEYSWMRSAYPEEKAPDNEYKAIRDAQQQLSDAGFYHGPVNGVDSPELREATLRAMRGEKPQQSTGGKDHFEYPWMRTKYPARKYED